MCLGGGDDPAEKAKKDQERAEAARQAKIVAGTKAVNDNFAAFDDNFYSGKTKSYNDYYLPEIDEQYKTANDRLINSLGSNLTGSEGAKQIGELAKEYEKAKSMYAQNAIDYANSIRSNLGTTRTQLITQLEGGGSIENAADQAKIAAENYAAQQQFSPLASLFSSAAAQTANAALSPNYGFAKTEGGLFNPKGKAGSVTNVSA